MNNASADYIALMARYDALAAELAHEKEQHELAHQAVSALERERDALRALWDRWLAIYAEEHDESCTPENCSMAALVADVRALRTERGADQPEPRRSDIEEAEQAEEDANRWRFARDNGLVWADRGFGNGCTAGRVGDIYATQFIDERRSFQTEQSRSEGKP